MRSAVNSSRSAFVNPVRPWDRPVRSCLARRRQIELAGHGADGLALVERKAYGARFELLRELPAHPTAAGIGCIADIASTFSEDVHETGSSA